MFYLVSQALQKLQILHTHPNRQIHTDTRYSVTHILHGYICPQSRRENCWLDTLLGQTHPSSPDLSQKALRDIKYDSMGSNPQGRGHFLWAQ